MERGSPQRATRSVCRARRTRTRPASLASLPPPGSQSECGCPPGVWCREPSATAAQEPANPYPTQSTLSSFFPTSKIPETPGPVLSGLPPPCHLRTLEVSTFGEAEELEGFSKKREGTVCSPAGLKGRGFSSIGRAPEARCLGQRLRPRPLPSSHAEAR